MNPTTDTPRQLPAPIAAMRGEPHGGCGIAELFEQTKRLFRTELCHEREARQKAEARIDRINNDNFNLANALSEAKAEVERLEARIAAIEKAEADTKSLAEVEANLRRAIEIAHEVAYSDSPDLWEELDKIKATVSSPNSLEHNPPTASPQ